MLQPVSVSIEWPMATAATMLRSQPRSSTRGRATNPRLYHSSQSLCGVNGDGRPGNRDGHTSTRLAHRRPHHPGGPNGPPGPCPGGGGPSGPPGPGGGPPNGPPGGGGPGWPGGGGGGGGSALATPAPMPATAAPSVPASNEQAMSFLNFTRPIHPSNRRFPTRRREIVLLAPLAARLGSQPEADLKKDGVRVLSAATTAR
jgi:hypothetical protein